MKKSIILLSALFICASSLFAQETERKSLNVTIYHDDLGVIRDLRTLDLKKGASEVKITDVANQIDMTSVHIKLDGSVIEQNFQYDLVSFLKVLQKYIDKEIDLIGENNCISGTLLSATANQIVIRKKDGGLLMLPKIDSYQISVGSLPEGLITKPTLVWQLVSNKDGKQDVEISYQTGGMSWSAEYVAVLDEKDTKIDLNSWVSLTNNSGTSYPDANLKLVAGEVNRIHDLRNIAREGIQSLKGLAAGAYDSEPQFAEREFFDYHIYDLQRQTTLANNETKQISLFEASDIKIKKKYRYISNGSVTNGKADVIIEFENKKDNNLGMPLPAGKVRVYKKDAKSLEFVGEDMIDHTPKDEKLKIKMGQAFDIVIEESEIESRRVVNNTWDKTYKVTLKNRKNEDINIEVQRSIMGGAEILESSIEYKKKDSRNILFNVPIKAGQEVEFTYSVRVGY
ncbi:MAG TPA: DUF4139 domain-containing protein [Candidatus Kapabacteria bacterium]|nr:DUF4139 domain-containing protein [Candidatus Kapabacteria bacterium]